MIMDHTLPQVLEAGITTVHQVHKSLSVIVLVASALFPQVSSPTLLPSLFPTTHSMFHLKLPSSLHTIPHDSHRGHTPTDEQQTNWIKDESLGYKGVEMWEGRLVRGGGMERKINSISHVTIVTTH